MPDAGRKPRQAIAGFWNDLHPGQAGTVYYRTLGAAPNRRFIVQFQGVQERFQAANLNTFQYKLFESSNKIEIHYQTLGSLGNNTIGIEDATGTVGLQYSAGGLPALGRPFAIRFSPTRVSNANDSGFGSLRQAIADVPAGGSVVFDPALSGQTITLTSGELMVSNSPWNVAPWTGDASSGVSNTLTYTHAYNFGTATAEVINGVTFTGVAGGSPSAANFTLAGPTQVLNGDVNNLPAGTGSRALATDLVYGGNPETLTLTGLTSGQSYRTSIFSVGFDAPGVRQITFAANGLSRVVDQGAYGNDNGIRVDYEFVASGTSQVITLTPVVPASTCHVYGFVNTVIPGGFANRLNIDASALPAGLTISGNNASRVFNINAGSAATFDSLTITGGATIGGAGIASYGTLALNRVTLAGNNAPGGHWGGGIYSNGALAMTHCTVANNSAEYGGGVFLDGGAGPTVLTHTTIANNLARLGGGGMWMNGASATIHNTIVAMNNANNVNPAGGAVLTQTGANITSGDPLLLPLANSGGLTPTMPPRGGGPAIDAGGATSLTTDQRGFPRTVGVKADIGAAESGPIVTVTSAADAGAGSLRQAITDATAPDTRIRFAAGLAGSTITLTTGELNAGTNRTLTLDGSGLTSGITVSGNNASRVLTMAGGSSVTVDSLTITGGRGTAGGVGGWGGGLAIPPGSHGNVRNSTLGGNSAVYGGGIYAFGGSKLTLENMIMANNTGTIGDADIHNEGSAFTLLGSNLIGSNSSVTAQFPTGPLVGTTAALKNPVLAPLGNYGGLTQTRPPLAGSPALNAAVVVPSSPTADQRGNVRPLGGASDLGAVESNFDLIVTTAANSGADSLRDALSIAIPGRHRQRPSRQRGVRRARRPGARRGRHPVRRRFPKPSHPGHLGGG